LKSQQKSKTAYNTKKCPECFTHLPLNAKKCTVCNTLVSDVNRHGMAKRPIDWRAYTICFLSWLVLGLYIWWAFLRD